MQDRRAFIETKRKKSVLLIPIIIMMISILGALWFSGFLPKQAVKSVAGKYLSQQEDKADYKLKMIEYSPAHDCYFAYYYKKQDPDGEIRNIGVNYSWIFFDVYKVNYGWNPSLSHLKCVVFRLCESLFSN